MELSKKVAKYNIKSLIKSLKIFYGVFCTIVILLAGYNYFITNEEIKMQGLELGSMIYLFCIGVIIFRDGFYFCQGNNVSRKNFFKGSLLTAGILSLIMSAISIVLESIVNIFIHVPMMYEMAFGSLGNKAIDLLSNYIFVAVTMMLTFLIGFLIEEIYFVLQKRGQMIFSVLLLGCFILIMNLGDSDLFEWVSFNNVFGSVLSMFVISILVSGIGYKIIKRCQVVK